MSGVPIPWWGKIAAKVVLSRLPAGYAFWQRTGLFKHGPMEDPAYAYTVFRKHFDRGRLPAGRAFVAAELGPGDTLGSALVAAALGARHTYLIDVGPFARRDIAPYLALHRHLVDNGLTPPDITGARSLEDVLTACRATYLTDGLASLRRLQDGDVDFLFSNAVFEHVRHADVAAMTREIARILSSGGFTSHTIDLKDHLGGGLANLRFAHRTWESPLMANSGFYTNRLRASDHVRMFQDAGLETTVLQTVRWDPVPITRRQMAPEFRTYSDDDLAISAIDIVARRAVSA